MKGRAKKGLILLATAVFAITLTACGSADDAQSAGESTAPATEPIVLKMANSNSSAMWNDEELNLMVAEKYFIEQLPIVTDGRYEVQIFLDGQLASDTNEQIQGLKSGAFDIVEMGTGSLADFTNAFAELNVPYLFKNQDVADAILNGEIGEDMMAKACADIGDIVPLYLSDNGFRQLTHADKVIKTPADLEGVKIRVQPDPIYIATFEALGASVQSVPYSELFTALQQHLVEAQENPVTNIYNQKLYEVQKTCTETNHMFTAFAYFIREDVYNAMSEEDQEAVKKLCAECQQLREDKMKEVTEKYKALLQDEGMEFYTPTAEELALFSDAMKENVWPMCEETMGAERWEKLQSAVADAEETLGL